MYKNKSQDNLKKIFNDITKPASIYQQPSPKYSPKPNEFEKLAYVATVFIFNQKPKNEFKHSETSPFQVVVPDKK